MALGGQWKGSMPDRLFWHERVWVFSCSHSDHLGIAV